MGNPPAMGFATAYHVTAGSIDYGCTSLGAGDQGSCTITFACGSSTTTAENYFYDGNGNCYAICYGSA